jgi:hypothetical protein
MKFFIVTVFNKKGEIVAKRDFDRREDAETFESEEIRKGNRIRFETVKTA